MKPERGKHSKPTVQAAVADRPGKKEPANVPLRTALVYDFDGTLARGNIQEHSLLPKYLETNPREFWKLVKKEKKEHNADEVLVYLRLLLERATALSKPITRKILDRHGRKTPLFDGVAKWFDRIDAHALKRHLALEHYVISSGNEEMIAGTRIGSKFRNIFASRYHYDGSGTAVGLATAINYTSKTQFLFRINKGVDNHWDNEAVNRWQPLRDRPIPFSRIIYFGDGDTDIPSMKMVRQQGGHSVAVFDPERWRKKRPEQLSKVFKLIAEDRAHFVVPADFREGSQLDITIKGVLGRIARDEAGYRE